MDVVADRLVKSRKQRAWSMNETCRHLAEELDINPKYLYQMAKYPKRYKPSPELEARMYEMLGEVPPKREYPPTITIRYEPGDTRRERAMGLSMEERRQALDEWRK